MPHFYFHSVTHIESDPVDEEQQINSVEMRSYLSDTSSNHYKNLNKATAGWREIVWELNVNNTMSRHSIVENIRTNNK